MKTKKISQIKCRGDTAIMAASKGRHAGLVKELVSLGANVLAWARMVVVQ